MAGKGLYLNRRPKGVRKPQAADWRSIEDDREKYAAYLCSREWAEKREAVRDRCGGKCERCGRLPMDHVHHLTYERKYREKLEDLQASCKYCHEFAHGKSDFDPCSPECGAVALYVRRLRSDSQLPGLPPAPKAAVPYQIQGNLFKPDPCLQFLMYAIDVILATPECDEHGCMEFGVEWAAEAINTLLPFDYVGVKRCSFVDVQAYDYWLRAFGYDRAEFTEHTCTEAPDA